MNGLRHLYNTRKLEVFRYACALMARDAVPCNRFVMIAHYRTGSTLLMSMLNSHSRIHVDGELFRPFMRLRCKTVPFPYLFIQGRLAGLTAHTYGFVLRLDHLDKITNRFVHDQPKEFLRTLSSDGWKIIHLKRHDHLRQAVSNLASIARGRAHYPAGRAVETRKVHIDPKALIRSINWMEEICRREHELVQNLKHISIVYEQGLLRSETHQATSERIFEYLGLDPEPVKAGYSRISTDDILESIDNAGEIRETIRKCGFASHL